MADHVTLPGTGQIVATDEVGGVQYQRVKTVWGGDGLANDVTIDNPFPVQAAGELIEAIQSMRIAINQLTKTIGYALPNALGQPIMEIRQATAANLNANVTIGSGTVTTVTTCATLTNQSQVGGFAANDYIPTLMHLQADNLRRNIAVT